MDLKSLCSDNLVQLIKNLPPAIRDELIGKTTEQIKKEAKIQVINEIREYACDTVDDVTDLIISSRKKGNDWTRPKYTYKIEDELFYTFVEMAETFINKHSETLVFGVPNSRPYVYSESETDNESE